MAPEFHQNVRRIFDQALELPEAERMPFVDTSCAGDEALREAVKRLLRAWGTSESNLTTTVYKQEPIGRYLIRGELGRGAMGVVYDALDPMIGRSVAVKVINLKAGGDPSQAEFMKDRLFREARSAGRLFHPGIVVILDVGVQDDSAYVTMERIEGRSLQQLLAQRGRLDPKEAIDIVKQTAAALDYAHQNGVVHRDIKPANIMIQGQSTVKVADFGIAKIISGESLTLTGVLMGTPSYMSPEQIEGRSVDGRSDQFSLAVVAYELLTGSRPFVADSMPTVSHLIVYGPRPPAHAANPALPQEVDAVLDRALNRFPEQRFANCAEFAAALETIFHGQPGVPRPPDQPKVQARRAPLLLALTAIFAVMLVAGGGLAYRFYAAPPPTAKAKTTPQPSITPPPAVVPAAPPKPTPVGEPASKSAIATPPSSPPIEKPATPDTHAPETRTDVPTPPPAEANADTKAKAMQAPQLYAMAMARRREGKLQESLVLLRQAADLRDSNAMQELGESCRTGDGATKNGVEAQRWFLRAAAAGNTASMVSLGAMYLLGDSVPQNEEEAARWFKRAADLKNPAGMYNLATLYETGQGVPLNAEKAKQLYRDAAALGDTESKRRLAQIQGQK